MYGFDMSATKIQIEPRLYCKQLDMLWSEIPFTPPQMRLFKSAAETFY